VPIADGEGFPRAKFRVEAQLLSSSSPWVYVYPRSTSWAEFSFGIGERKVWFNGNLNIDINVYEDPDDYYGGCGGYASGSAGAAGATSRDRGVSRAAPADFLRGRRALARWARRSVAIERSAFSSLPER
jgi:hypothetical protein